MEFTLTLSADEVRVLNQFHLIKLMRIRDSEADRFEGGDTSDTSAETRRHYEYYRDRLLELPLPDETEPLWGVCKACGDRLGGVIICEKEWEELIEYRRAGRES